ncbi:hypothetical protein C5Y93_11235 [Blastopirellula marina]|uniref:Protein kinase domain-containing protein n=2 Tax=Blastopirellula marina TaxID=124 RepID=A0A2S8GN26_9BACT|nr:hypothetical protein C5Y93_11235 [Blastopirellula marina]
MQASGNFPSAATGESDMSVNRRTDLADPRSLTALEQIDAICVAAEKDWQAGASPPIEHFLLGISGELHEELLTELLPIELHYRRQRGEDPPLQEYCQRFPDYAAAVADAFARAAEIIAQEAELPQLPPRYEPISEIDRGGMGVVWRVRDRHFDRPLAVKVILPKFAGDPRAATRFQRETQLTGSLQHPAIPPVVDCGQLADGSPFFSMKLIEGETLRALLDERANAPSLDQASNLTKLLSIFEQACQAIGYAHSTGVIHRDLKPSNIMVGAFGEVQVMDWGMAKRLTAPAESRLPPTLGDRRDEIVSTAVEAHSTNEEYLRISQLDLDDTAELQAGLTRDGDVLGTLAYMSPEQANGDIAALDCRSDVFSLGAILCEILTGSPPYHGKGMWRRVLSGDLSDAFARLDDADVDPELIELCKRCLAPDRSERIQQAAEISDAYHQWEEQVRARLVQEQQNRVVAETRTLEANKRAGLERSRRQVAIALAATVFVLLVSGGLIGNWYVEKRIEEQATAKAKSENARAEIITLVAQAAELRDQYEFEMAHTHLSQAKTRLPMVLDSSSLRGELEAASSDLAMAATLDAIRSSQATWAIDGFNRDFAKGSDGAYAQAFRKYGIELSGTEKVGDFASLIRRSPIRDRLLAALDDWATDDAELRVPILHLASSADAGERQRFRDPQTWRDRELLTSISNVELSALPPATITSLAHRLRSIGELEAAAEMLREAARLYPQDFWVVFDCALMHSKIDQPEAAIGFYHAARAVRPKNSAAHTNLGLQLDKVGRDFEAETAFRAAIEYDPTNVPALGNLGIMLMATGRDEEAAQRFRAAVKINPRNPNAHANLGLLLKKKGEFEKAAAAFESAIELRSNSANLHRDLGNILAKLGRRDEAVHHAKEAIRINPSYTAAHNDLGVLYAELGDFSAAKEAYEKASETDPKYAKSYNNLALLLRGAGQFDEAEAAYKKAIEIDPEYSLAYYNLGLHYMKLGRNDEAEEMIRRSLDIYPNRAAAHCDLGLLLYKKKLLAQAEKEYRTCIDLDRTYAKAHGHLARLLEETGRPDEATAEYQEAHQMNRNSAAARSN